MPLDRDSRYNLKISMQTGSPTKKDLTRGKINLHTIRSLPWMVHPSRKGWRRTAGGGVQLDYTRTAKRISAQTEHTAGGQRRYPKILGGGKGATTGPLADERKSPISRSSFLTRLGPAANKGKGHEGLKKRKQSDSNLSPYWLSPSEGSRRGKKHREEGARERLVDGRKEKIEHRGGRLRAGSEILSVKRQNGKILEGYKGKSVYEYVGGEEEGGSHRRNSWVGTTSRKRFWRGRRKWALRRGEGEGNLF